MGSNSISHLVTRYVDPIEIKHAKVIDLYEEYASNLGTNYLNINLQPGSVQANGNFIGINPIPLHRSSRYLWEMMPAGYDEAFLHVEYYYGIKGFDPEEKLTLREFFMRTLDIWNAMVLPLSETPQYDKSTGKFGVSKEATDVITAMDVLKRTYKLEELMDTWTGPDGVKHKTTMESFKALFDVPKILKLTDGGGSSDATGFIE